MIWSGHGGSRQAGEMQIDRMLGSRGEMQTDLFLLCTKLSMLRFANSYILDLANFYISDVEKISDILNLETVTSQRIWRKSQIF
jgi:hypothetical protein